MSLYAMQLNKSPEVDEWLKQTMERSKDNSMLKNPFVWRIKQRTKKGRSIIVVDVKPLFPNFSWLGWMSGVTVLFVWGATKWLIPCFIVGGLGVFWTSEFFFLMTKKALRKAGYSGPIKRLKFSAVIREVIL